MFFPLVVKKDNTPRQAGLATPRDAKKNALFCPLWAAGGETRTV
jgi:hypothetical protein